MALSLLVVGHANTGKTSLIRTLLRRHDFGTVSAKAGATRHVEKVPLSIADRHILTLTDTPGFEDSMALWEIRQGADFQHLQGPQWLRAFCASPYAQQEFEQEAKILNQLESCDIILYVIDARQAPLGKYQDELSLLASASKPIIPILNFSAESSPHYASWKQVLASRHLHAMVKYDSVAFYFADEKRLYQSVQSLMPDHYEAIEALITDRQNAAQLRLQLALQQLTESLIRLASWRLECDTYPASAAQTHQFEQQVRHIEEQLIKQLLALYEFRPQDLASTPLPVRNGRWQQDIFAKQTLQEWGINAGTSALTGAAIGASIDVLAAGLTLGTATTLGALLGAGWKTGQHYKDTLKSKLTKHYFITLDNATLSVFTLRGLTLIRHLDQRGHASQQAFVLTDDSDDSGTKKLISALRPLWQQAQQHPSWFQQPIASDHSSFQAMYNLLHRHLKSLPTDT